MGNHGHVQLFCGWSGLINGLSCLALAIFLYFRKPSGKINKIFALWSFNVALWSLGYFVWLFVDTPDQALFWSRILMIGCIIIPSSFVHFVLAYLDLDQKHRMFIAFCYSFSAAYLILDFTPYLVSRVEPRYWFQWWPVPGFLFYPYTAFFIMTVIYAYILLFYQIQRVESVIQKKQLKIVALGTLIAYGGGSTNFFLWYNIPVPPVFNFMVTFYVAFIAYAILHYKLWDIDFIVRRTIVFTGIMGIFLFIFLSMTYVLNLIISSYVNINSNIAALIAFGVGIIIYRPAEKFLIDLTDKYLFQKKYDYQKLLKDASKGISKIENLDHLFGLVIHFITMRMRITQAAILSKEKDTHRYILQYQRGYQKNYLSYSLEENNSLVQYMLLEKESIEIESVREYIKVGGKKNRNGELVNDYSFTDILKQMNELGAACCVPSFLGHELRNMLVLGEKKSGEIITSMDLDVLFTLAQESAIAIENARLYDEAVRKTKELEKINEALESAKMRLTEALQETESANKQLQDAQVQLVHEQKMATLGRLAASVGHEVNNPLTILSMNVSRAILKFRKNPDLKVNEILDVFQKMEQNISRIKAVVNTLTGLLKKSEKGKFEPLSLKLILEETLPLVQFQTYLDNLAGTEVEFNIPGNVPLIRGDLERLQEVFLNLFINAYHAMSGRRNPRIEVRADWDPQNPKFVAIHFTDNGNGMAEDVMKKIFTYGFTTKPPGRGSGMGLYMCRYIIELHGGEIRVKSTLGVGTTFTLTLPIYQESSLSHVDVAKTG